MAVNGLTERTGEKSLQAREETRSNEKYIKPAVNIIETDEGLTLTADLPGAAKETLDVNVEKGILTISAPANRSMPGRPPPIRKRAERRRVAKHHGKQRRGEADPDRGNERCLVSIEPDHGANESRDYDDANADQSNEECPEAHSGQSKTLRCYSSTRRNRGQHRDQEDRNEILDDQNPEDYLRQLASNALLGECSGDDRRARDRDDCAGKDAFDRGPSKYPPEHVAESEHHARLEQGGDPGGCRDLDDASQPELEAERKHEENHAEFGECAHHSLVGGEWNRRVRPDDHPGEQIAEDDRLLQSLKDDSGDCSGAEYEREILKKGMRVTHSRILSLLGLVPPDFKIEKDNS